MLQNPHYDIIYMEPTISSNMLQNPHYMASIFWACRHPTANSLTLFIPSFLGLAEVTKLIKREGETPLERPRQPFKFVTDIYFLTQQCMNLGFHVLLEDFYTLNRQLHQLQEAYRDATATGGGATGNPLITRLHEEMEKGEWWSKDTTLSLRKELQFQRLKKQGQFSQKKSKNICNLYFRCITLLIW